jgi:hypothetical protein
MARIILARRFVFACYSVHPGPNMLIKMSGCTTSDGFVRRVDKGWRKKEGRENGFIANQEAGSKKKFKYFDYLRG